LRDAVRTRSWLLGAALLCVWMLLSHGRAAAAGTCTVTETSAAVTNSLTLGAFDPTALAAGTAITGTISGNCKKLTANTVVITFSNGSNYTGTNRAMKCAACAGPTPFFLLQYQLFETNGTTVFPTAGVTVTCTTTCTGNPNGTYTYNFVGQILQPVAASSLNDAQIGSYSDATLTATVTGNGAPAVVTPDIATTATVAVNCTISTTTDIGFGAYNPLTVASVTDSTGVVTVTCTRGNSGITVAVNGGNNAAHATTPQTRAMIGATSGNYLSYDIFETAAYATRFPTTAVAETIPTGITTPTLLSLFGQIPAAAQDVSIDTYSDSVQVTVNF
jgi:spore coat protein U-like protein